MTDYSQHDRQRWAPESAKRRDRTAFERDRARVLHSSALRRLAAKTQVAAPGADDFLRTRLTHSLECGQIGRELGKSLGCDPDLVETACLAHDIGHPPFGHNGEVALERIAEACGGFEGNAQSLRILTRLEPKSFASDGRSVGLNLTRATLDASLKYPWPRPAAGTGKFGVYADDSSAAAWIREGVTGLRQSFEAQVMDWSDDIAYSVHDLEDALVSGPVRLEQLADPEERRAVCETAARMYGAALDGSHGDVDRSHGDVDIAELEERFTTLVNQPYWPSSYDGTPRTLAALKHLTSWLIGRFCMAAEGATRAAYGPGPLTRHRADLIIPRATRLECSVLKAVTAHYVWISHEVTRARQRELLMELAELLIKGAPDTLEPIFHTAYAAAADDRGRLRVVVDQIASLTDTSAIARHRLLTTN